MPPKVRQREELLLVTVGAVVVLIGLVIAIRARRVVLYDDAAITFRYAVRIAHGHGWTYNDGDRTNGASAPLYTMVLAAASRIGWNLETAAKVIGVACYALSLGLVVYIAGRISGLAAGLTAALLLAVSADYRIQALSGMESVLASVLGLATIALLLQGRESWAGVILGLAIVNKLDAGMLALALAVAYLCIMRRPPWRIVVVSTAVLAPWLLFSVAYFGSPLPYSMTQKLGPTQNAATVFDRWWIVDALRTDSSILIALLTIGALVAVPALARTHRYFAVALATCVAWPIFHGVVFSLVDFGDPYPWYRAVLYPPMAIAAATLLLLVVRAASGAGRPIAVTVLACLVAFTVGLADDRFGRVGSTVRTVAHGHEVDPFESFEAARREAGLYLHHAAAKGDVVETCFGWVAYGAIDNPIKETCPLNTRVRVGRPRWAIAVSLPGTPTRTVPSYGTRVMTFDSPDPLGGAVYVVRLPAAAER